MLKKLNWGHGVAIALGSFIIFILFLIFVYSSGMKNSELISDDYYQDELTYQQVIDAKNNAETLSQKPSYSQDKNGITIVFPQSVSVDDSKVNFTLFRTDDGNLDVKKEITLDGRKQFTIPSKVLSAGSYTLKVSWKENKKPYQLDYDVQWK